MVSTRTASGPPVASARRPASIQATLVVRRWAGTTLLWLTAPPLTGERSIHYRMYTAAYGRSRPMVLPPGQRAVQGFPRFGVELTSPPPVPPTDLVIEISGQ